MSRRFLALFLILGGLLSLGAALQQKQYGADRFDVDAVLLEGGTLEVTETVTFRFTGGPFTYVFRELPARSTDGVTVLAASVDGRAYTAGTNAGQVEVTGRDPVKVTWHVEPTSDAARTFTLSYRMAGVVRQESDADFLHWWPLPDQHEYTIANGSVRLSYPAGTELLSTSSIAGGAGTVDASTRTVQVTAQDLGPNDSVSLALRFPAGSLLAAPPAWQARQIERQEASWWWIGLAGVIAAAGTVSALGFGLLGRRPVQMPSGRQLEPPAGVMAWQIGMLQGNGAGVNWNHALAILFSLANRGALELEETRPGGWFRSREFTIRQLKQPADLSRAEGALLALLFESKNGPQDAVTLSELSRRISSGRWKTFSRTLQDAFEADGLVDSGRRSTRRVLEFGTLALILAGGVAALAMGFLLGGRYGAWPLLVGGALLLVALAWLVVAATYSVLSDKAARLAGASRRFANELRQISRGKASPARSDAFDHYLPYAAAIGLLPAWTKQFEKRGWTAVPPWFHALSAADDRAAMGAFVAMAAASGTSGGSAAGAAGGAAAAGAAGGGASGAG